MVHPMRWARAAAACGGSRVRSVGMPGGAPVSDSYCRMCMKPLPLSRGNGYPRKLCDEKACYLASRRGKLAPKPPPRADCCPRCEMPTSGKNGRRTDCLDCSAKLNRHIKRWLEEQPKPVPMGEASELALELGLSMAAIHQRIRRVRLGIAWGLR